MTLSLEDQRRNLKTTIVELEARLKDVEARIHARRVRDSGLAGRIARSDRVPGGIIIDDVVFKTWAPAEVQAVCGPRCGVPDFYTTIPMTSTGARIDDANHAGVRAQ